MFSFTFLVGWTGFVVAQILFSAENYPLSVGRCTLVAAYEIPWP